MSARCDEDPKGLGMRDKTTARLLRTRAWKGSVCVGTELHQIGNPFRIVAACTSPSCEQLHELGIHLRGRWTWRHMCEPDLCHRWLHPSGATLLIRVDRA